MTQKTLHSFSELKEILKKSNRTPMNMVKPICLRELAKITGNHNKVAEMIGVSRSHVSTSLSSDSVRLSFELAAKAILNEMKDHTKSSTIYFVEVNKDQKNIVEAFFRGMNLRATSL
jgi:predicted transcriptional regulator